MLMKRLFTRLMAAMLCLAASLTASAQFSATIEMYPSSGWDSDTHDFSLSEVATALGTDVATLVSTLDAWFVNDNPDVFYFQTENFVPTQLSDYAADNRGFWMTLDGTVVAYGQKEEGTETEMQAMYNYFAWDDEAGTFTVALGQMAGKLAAGDEGHVKLVVAFGEKKATFDMTLKIIEKPSYDVPEPTTTLADLQIVGTETVKVHQYARSTYDADGIKVALPQAATLLGTSNTVLAGALEKIFYTTEKELEDGANLGMAKPVLTNKSTANAIGFWFQCLKDPNGDNVDLPEVAAAPFSGSHFYMEAITFADDTLGFNIGQMPGTLAAGDSLVAHTYLIYGSKAFQLDVNLLIDEREALPFEEMTEVGYDSLFYEQYPTTDYSTTAVNVDLEAIANLLGTDSKDLLFWALDGNGNVTDGYTTGGEGGFWLTADGTVTNWGSGSVFYVNPKTAGDYSQFSVGQYPNTMKAGDSATAKLFLVGNNSTYYTLYVVLNVVEKPAPVVEFTSVAERAVDVQVVPSSGDYPIPDMDYVINMDEVEQLTGSKNVTLFAREAPADGGEWTSGYSDSYSCDPKPGFWMSADGYASTWGSSPWGFSYQASEPNFTFFQMPGMSGNEVGATFTAPVYLVNMENGKMITYNITIRFVEKVEFTHVEEVGQETIVVPVSLQKNGSIETYVDVSKAIEALDVVDAQELLNAQMRVSMADGTFSDGIQMAQGEAPITKAGAFDATDGYDDTSILLVMDLGGDKTLIFIPENYNGDIEAGEIISTKLAFDVAKEDDKVLRYSFLVIFTDPETATGINAVQTAKSANVVYNLAGQRVSGKLQRGVYVKDGKKVILK